MFLNLEIRDSGFGLDTSCKKIEQNYSTRLIINWKMFCSFNLLIQVPQNHPKKHGHKNLDIVLCHYCWGRLIWSLVERDFRKSRGRESVLMYCHWPLHSNTSLIFCRYIYIYMYNWNLYHLITSLRPSK